MDVLNADLLLRLLAAHFLSDFVFQPTNWARNKERKGLKSGHLYVHILITAITLFVVLWDIKLWYLVFIISFLHFLIDLTKGVIKINNIWVFVADQFFHMLILFTVWLIVTQQGDEFFSLLSLVVNNQKFWWLLLGYTVLTIPCSVLIGILTGKWSSELNHANQNEGLESAGKWIGIIERLLILTFILVNQFNIIGFLLAAKSVFRFGDLKDSADRKKTEYIIIGTFLSFSLAIFAGLIIQSVFND